MIILEALAEAIETGRQAARFLGWCALLAAAVWAGWRMWGGIAG